MTFTKLFSSITESTVWCENDQVRIVWITMLAMANQNGKVFGSIPGLANRARVPIAAVEEALTKFMAPDPYSRTKDFEGRRIEEIDGGWKLLTYAKHRDSRNEEERREYQRAWVARKRTLSTNVDSVVDQCRPQSTHTDTDTDTDTDNTKSKTALRAFTPPSLEEVALYCKERGNQVNPEQFLYYYESIGWRRGRNSIKNWRACVRTWENNNYGGEFKGGYQKSAAQLRNERNKAIAERIFREDEPATDVCPSSGKGTP